MKVEQFVGNSVNHFFQFQKSAKELIQPTFFENNGKSYVTLDLQRKKKYFLKNAIFLKNEKSFLDESKKLLLNFFFPVKKIYFLFYFIFIF